MQMKNYFEKFCTVGTMYLMNCCHRNLTRNTTPGNDDLSEKKEHLSAKNFIVRLL